MVLFEGAAAATLLPRLLPLLDGTRTADALAALLGVPAAAVEHALRALATRRLLWDGPPQPGLSPVLRETVEQLAADAELPPSIVGERLAAASIAVVGSSRAARVAAALIADAGVAVVRPGRWRDARAELVLAAPGRAETGALRRLNRRALRRGTTWLPVLPYDGRIAIAGPLVVPGETACFTCYRLRRAAASGYGEELLVLDRAAVAAASSATVERLAAELAVLHALRWLGTRDARLPGTLQSVELADGVVVERHTVLRVPRCPACSGLGELAPPLPWFDLPLERA